MNPQPNPVPAPTPTSTPTSTTVGVKSPRRPRKRANRKSSKSNKSSKSKITTRNIDRLGAAYKTSHTSIRLGDEDKAKLAALAHAMHGGINKSAVVRLLVRAAYDKLILKQKPSPNEEVR